jgi:hypothetical protein
MYKEDFYVSRTSHHSWFDGAYAARALPGAQ